MIEKKENVIQKYWNQILFLENDITHILQMYTEMKMRWRTELESQKRSQEQLLGCPVLNTADAQCSRFATPHTHGGTSVGNLKSPQTKEPSSDYGGGD